MNPVSFKDALAFGSDDSNVAVCCLWSEKGKIAEHLGKSDYAVIGNLYSNAGINAAIRNILANPKIRFVAMFGDDLSKSGECLKAFFEKGVDENSVVCGTRTAIEEEISKEAVESLRKNVSLIDLRGKDVNEFKSEIRKLNGKNLPAFAEPQTFPESKKTSIQLESETTGFVVRGKTIAETWLKVLGLVLRFGHEKPSEYPLRQKELLNITAVIEGKDESLAGFFSFTDKDLRQYLPSILTPHRPENIAYTYGSRLFSGTDQIKNAVEKLKACPHSRRAAAFTWQVEEDSKSEHPPCLTHILWSIQNNKLLQTVHFRSHELFEAWPMNLLALKELQERVGKDVGVEPGQLTCISHSAHIYENKWEDAKRVTEKHHKPEKGLELDPRGNFRIWLENKKIMAEHMDSEGGKTGNMFEGGSAAELISGILHSSLISRLDHAAYLGKELEKAENALKNRREYVQDKV